MASAIVSIFECVQCKMPLRFGHTDQTVKVCPHCSTVNHKLEGNVLVPKPYPVIDTADSVVQPGTTGSWKGNSFTVTGRMRFWFTEHVFNYWTIQFADNTLGYLAEAYGLYAIYQLTKPSEPLVTPKFDWLELNNEVTLGDSTNYYVQRIYKSAHIDVEGEIWLPENKQEFTIVEMASQTGKHIEIMEFLNNYRLYFDVAHTSLEALQLANLREWKNKETVIECKECQQPIRLENFPYAQSCACTHCGTAHFYEQGKFSRKGKESSERSTPAIALGSTGELKGVLYKVIGYNHKKDFSIGQSEWREYTLFNPQQGYAFLSEYDGHWMFVKEENDAPVLITDSTDHFQFNDLHYHLYNQYTFKTMSAEGEFMGNVMNDSGISVREYINPPEMWIREKNKREGINWFNATHLPADELAKAFTFEAIPQVGMGALDPKGGTNPWSIVRNTFYVVLVFLLVFIVLSFNHSEKTLLEKQYSATDSTGVANVVTDKFHLDKWKSNLEIEIYAPVDNDWFELGTTLVNTDNGKEYSVAQGVEYYEGYDDGESWSEGSKSETVYLDGIPAGNYQLQFTGTKNTAKPYGVTYFNVTVRYDVTMWRNFFIILGLLLIWPIIKYLRVRAIEKKRWSTSAFTPGNYEY